MLFSRLPSQIQVKQGEKASNQSKGFCSVLPAYHTSQQTPSVWLFEAQEAVLIFVSAACIYTVHTNIHSARKAPNTTPQRRSNCLSWSKVPWATASLQTCQRWLTMDSHSSCLSSFGSSASHTSAGKSLSQRDISGNAVCSSAFC